MDVRAGPSHSMELSLAEQPDLTSPPQGLLSDQLNFNDILIFTAQEVQEEAARLEALGEKLEQQKRSKASKSKNSSRSYTAEQEYKEILNKKKNFADKLIDVLERQEPSGIPKFNLQCSEELASGLASKAKEAMEEIQNQTAQLLKTRNESKMMESHVQIYYHLNDSEDSEGRTSDQEDIRIKRLFEEAKQDLNTVLTTVYPNDEERNEFIASLKELIQKYVSSETEEEKYIEILPLNLKNKGMRCLLQGGIVIQHPQQQNKYRISVEE